MKLIEILGIKVKLIEEMESYSFFQRISEKMYTLNYRQKSAQKGYNYYIPICTNVQNRIIFH